jgi:uncharacterized protein GlcG (DUF336 family)
MARDQEPNRTFIVIIYGGSSNTVLRAVLRELVEKTVDGEAARAGRTIPAGRRLEKPFPVPPTIAWCSPDGEDHMRKIPFGVIATSAALVFTASVFAQQAPTPPPAPSFGTPISLEQAMLAMQAAIAEAKRIGVNEAVAVVEPTGDLVHLSKMDGASYSAIALSQAKAVTAARYRRPTKFFNEQVESGQLFFLSFPQMVASPGGVLIVVDGKTIGAIAASGGNGEQDAQVAAAVK